MRKSVHPEIGPRHDPAGISDVVNMLLIRQKSTRSLLTRTDRNGSTESLPTEEYEEWIRDIFQIINFTNAHFKKAIIIAEQRARYHQLRLLYYASLRNIQSLFMGTSLLTSPIEKQHIYLLEAANALIYVLNEIHKEELLVKGPSVE